MSAMRTSPDFAALLSPAGLGWAQSVTHSARTQLLQALAVVCARRS